MGEGAYPEIRHLIAGIPENGPSAARAVLNPATGDEIGRIPDSDTAMLARLPAIAWQGFVSWRAVPAHDRAAVLKKAAGRMRAEVESLAVTITTEQGKPLAESRGEIFGTAAIFEWLADEACRVQGEVLASRIKGFRQVIEHEPIGPVLAIAPWNMPAMMAGRKIAHALAAGCSVIVKPASETPAIVIRLAELLIEAGLPPEAITVIHGNSAEIARTLIAAPEIRKVSFTGSTEVGRELGGICGRHIKRFTAELGGHAPVILHEDADVDAAAAMLVAGKFFNAGQSCMAPTRFFVHRSITGAFAEAFAARVAGIVVGPGLEAGTTMGAMINRRAVDDMAGFVADATAKGAELRFGGDRPAGAGSFFAPTVLMDVPPSARIMTEEPYGPLAPIAPYDRLDEAIAAANALPYGLCAYVFGRDAARNARTARALEAGLVGINTLNVGGPMVPFGGVKDSGLGREGGRHGLLEHYVTKTCSTVDAT